MLLETGNCHFKSIGWGSQMNVISLKLGLSLTPLHLYQAWQFDILK